MSGISVTNSLASAIEDLLNSADTKVSDAGCCISAALRWFCGRMFSDVLMRIVFAGGGRQVFLVGCLYD